MFDAVGKGFQLFNTIAEIVKGWLGRKEKDQIENTGRQLQNSDARGEVIKTHEKVNRREEDIARVSDDDLDERLSRFERHPSSTSSSDK